MKSEHWTIRRRVYLEETGRLEQLDREDIETRLALPAHQSLRRPELKKLASQGQNSK